MQVNCIRSHKLFTPRGQRKHSPAPPPGTRRPYMGKATSADGPGATCCPSFSGRRVHLLPQPSRDPIGGQSLTHAWPNPAHPARRRRLGFERAALQTRSGLLSSGCGCCSCKAGSCCFTRLVLTAERRRRCSICRPSCGDPGEACGQVAGRSPLAAGWEKAERRCNGEVTWD